MKNLTRRHEDTKRGNGPSAFFGRAEGPPHNSLGQRPRSYDHPRLSPVGATHSPRLCVAPSGLIRAGAGGPGASPQAMMQRAVGALRVFVSSCETSLEPETAKTAPAQPSPASAKASPAMENQSKAVGDYRTPKCFASQLRKAQPFWSAVALYRFGISPFTLQHHAQR